MSIPKAHHYIPRFYLDGFTNADGKLWVYESGRQPRISTPKESAHRRFFYAFDKNGERSLLTEETLGKLEDYTAPTIRKFRSGDLSISAQERNDIAGFVALMFSRTPYFHENMDRVACEIAARNAKLYARTPGLLEWAYEELEKDGKNPEATVEQVREFMLSDRYTMKQESRAWTLQTMFEAMLELQPIIERMKWNWLIAAEDEFFVTSDNPVALFDRNAPFGTAGFMSSPSAQFTFPIDSKLCLYARWHGTEETHRLSTNQTILTNRRTIFRSYRYVFAKERSEAIAKEVDEIHAQRGRKKSVPTGAEATQENRSQAETAKGNS